MLCNRFVFFTFLTVCSVYVFIPMCCYNNGSLIVNGPAFIRQLYCGRNVKNRSPIHFNSEKCNGSCPIRDDVKDKFVVTVSDETYWSSILNVTVQTLPGSLYRLTGFAVSATNSDGNVVGTFQSADDLVIGRCKPEVKEEGTAVFHAAADDARATLTLKWRGPTKNYRDIRFSVWITHNYTTTFYMESDVIRSKYNGSKQLNLESTLSQILDPLSPKKSKVMQHFESSFDARYTFGYDLDSGDPFDALRRLPMPEDLIPVTKQRDPPNSERLEINGLPSDVKGFNPSL